MGNKSDTLITIKVRKHKRSQPLDDNRTLMKYSKIASRRAIEDLLEAGISVVYTKDGQLVRKSPDKEITVIREAREADTFDLRGYLCQG